MFGKRFFISWLVSSLVMFGASYLWHGLILTDFDRMAYPKGIFLSVASVVYLIIGLVVNKVYEIRILAEKFPKMIVVKGLIAGSLCGLVMYMITMVIGVSFNYSMTMGNMLLDVSWQMVEGSLGGVAVSVVHMFVYEDRAFDVD